MNNGPQPQFKLSRTIEFIEDLNGGGERRLWWDDIKERIDLMTEGHLFIQGTLPDDGTWYRGRQIFNDSYYSNTDKLTLRNKEDITNYGRCNKPGQSVLYASNNLETVYSELGLHVGDHIELITIKKKDDLEVSYISVGEIDHVRRHNTSQFGNKDIADSIRSYWDTLNFIDRLRLNVTDAFIADRFRQEANNQYKYKITSAYSDIVFAQGVDAFIYPSVGHLGGWNIAISEDAFNNKFEITKVELVEIYDVLGYGIFGTVTYGQSDEVDSTTGEISWKKMLGQKFWGDFDAFLNYTLTLAGHHTMFLFFLKYEHGLDANADPEMIKIQDAAKSIGNGKLMSFKIIFDANVRLNPSLEFSKLIEFADNHNKDWDSVCITTETNINNGNEADSYVARMKELFKNDISSACIFTRDGTQVSMSAPPEILNFCK